MSYTLCLLRSREREREMHLRFKIIKLVSSQSACAHLPLLTQGKCTNPSASIWQNILAVTLSLFSAKLSELCFWRATPMPTFQWARQGNITESLVFKAEKGRKDSIIPQNKTRRWMEYTSKFCNMEVKSFSYKLTVISTTFNLLPRRKHIIGWEWISANQSPSCGFSYHHLRGKMV